jgi:hypothetical protein
VKIISHRGAWLEASEKNTEIAFRRSFDRGFGVETDVRDCAGELVIAHEMPDGKNVRLEAFLIFSPDAIYLWQSTSRPMASRQN